MLTTTHMRSTGHDDMTGLCEHGKVGRQPLGAVLLESARTLCTSGVQTL